MSYGALVVCFTFIFASIAAIKFYPVYLGVPHSLAMKILGIAYLAGAAACFFRVVTLRQGAGLYRAYPGEGAVGLMGLCTFLLVLVLVPFVVKLYGKFMDGQLTPAEKAPGAPGIRAWLGGGNLIVAVLIALLAWKAFDYPLVILLTLTIGALVAYPLLNFAKETPAPVHAHSTEAADLGADRDRILQMLTDGRITPDESADLLNALGASRKTQSTTPPTSGRKLVMVGAALVLLGFFLPWFSFNLQHEMQRQASQLGVSMPSFPPEATRSGVTINGAESLPGIFFPTQMQANINIAGGDIAHGLGWLVLALALAVAALPYLAPRIDMQTQHTISFLALGVGAVIVLYLLSQNVRIASIGIVFAVLGYVCAFVGELKDA